MATLGVSVPAAAVSAHPGEQRPSSSAACAVLGQGATGKAVAEIQRAVHAGSDGQFGPHTAAKLRTWQTKHHVSATGEVDAATWAALPRAVAIRACGRSVTDAGTSCATISQGDTGLAVTVLQKALGVTEDGDFGPATAAALEHRQRKAKLSDDGVTDPDTWHALGLDYTPVCAELSPDQKAQARIHAHVAKMAAELEQAAGTSTSTTQHKAVHFARKQIGKPYKYGAVGPKSYDCSGLQMTAYQHAGVAIPRVAAAQYASGGTKVWLSKARAGDLLFFASDVNQPASVYHVMMYVGHGKILDAPYTGKDVEISPLWTGDLLPHVVRPG
jgi:cell wall-associated NlpC family hydrolase